MPSASKFSIFAIFVWVCLVMNRLPNDGNSLSDVLVERTKSSSCVCVRGRPNTEDSVSHACVEKTKRLFAECGKYQRSLKCSCRNEEFDVGISSSVVLPKERSMKTPEVDAKEGEGSSSESNLDTSVCAEIRSPENVSDEFIWPEVQPKGVVVFAMRSPEILSLIHI